MAASQFCLQCGKQSKSRVGEGRHSFCFLSIIPCWKRSVRRCVVLMQQPVLLLPKFDSESSHIFMQSPKNGRVMYGIECLVCEQSPWCEGKWRACSWLRCLPVSPFSVCPEHSIPFKHPCTAHAFIPDRFSFPGSLSHFSFEIFTKFYCVPLSNPLRNSIRTDTRLQIKKQKQN
jgi:hypothetical protein